MTKFKCLAFILFLGFGLTVQAEDIRLEDLPEPPPPPPAPLSSGEALEPEIIITQRDDAQVEEYRLNGHLFMIKVTPAVGPSYYLKDMDGDGEMESRMSELYSDVVIPQWVLLSWD